MTPNNTPNGGAVRELLAKQNEWIRRGVHNGCFDHQTGADLLAAYDALPAAPGDEAVAWPNVTDKMVYRFLSWRLPGHIKPDGHYPPSECPYPMTGTNLLDFDAAKQMLEYVLVDMSPQAQLARVIAEAFSEDDDEPTESEDMEPWRTAWYEVAHALGIPAMPKSPELAHRDEVMPRLRKLLRPPALGAEWTMEDAQSLCRYFTANRCDMSPNWMLDALRSTFPQGRPAAEVGGALTATGDQVVRCYGKSAEGSDVVATYSAQAICDMGHDVMLRSCMNSLSLPPQQTPSGAGGDGLRVECDRCGAVAAMGCPCGGQYQAAPRDAVAPDGGEKRNPLSADEVEWVVNDIAELGVKIGNQFFFLYKGNSLVYVGPNEDTDPPRPHYWRHVFKREFGECAHPLNHENPNLIGTVSLEDSDEWKIIPGTEVDPTALAGEGSDR
jgi:hypothetical protein